MRRALLVFGILLSLLNLLSSHTTRAQGPAGSDPQEAGEPYAGEALCLPGVYLQEPDGCLALGPSTYLTGLAKRGFTFPVKALPALAADPSRSLLPYQYLKVTRGSIPLYGSLDDAIAHNRSGFIEAGMKYLVIYERVDTDSGTFYSLPSGYWIDGGEAEAACCIVSGRFQGMGFRHPPRNAFGWILTTTPVYTAPGYASPQTGRELFRETLLQVYAVEQADNVKWVMIGIDEWIEDRVIARVTPNPVPPQGVPGERWIEINLEEQVMLVYDQRQLVYATMVSTGVEPFYTRPGLFQVYQKKDTETMRGSFEADRSDYYYLENVPWTMYFDEARALHAAYWHTLFGYPQSHGCVNLSPADARWLYEWAQDGEWVYVWDPSGLTPTDPAFYGAGGA
jgi:hypothetical protein